jgi:DnaJ-class molecular chaperone
MKLQNYYRLLNIETSADLNTIKKAFRTEIALYHPDNNKSESARVRFDLIVEAFDILSNSKKRAAYDALLSTSETNKPLIIAPKAEKQYKKWTTESKKKSESYWSTSLGELLVLDLFLDSGLLNSMLSGSEDLLDGLSDSFGDIGDLFDIF